jgi:hypothetical protein
MKKWLLYFLCAAGLARPVLGEDLSAHTGLFANGKEVFRPLLADPREIQMALRLVTPVSHTNFGEVDVGDYFGLYRWALPWADSYVQWSIAGGIFAKFDLVSVQKDLQVIDFTANMPIDLRVKKWSLRVMPYHISSHLGDDYIKHTGILPDKYSFDSYKTLIAYEPWSCLRLYGGANYIIRNSKDYLGRYAVQTGMEWTSGWWARGHAQLYWATDFQSWERVGWNPTVNTQLGVHIGNHPEDRQKLSLYTEYGSGHSAFGQFFQQQESHWVLGLRFDMS